MSALNVPIGATHADSIKFVCEDHSGEVIRVPVEPQEWDVSDPSAQRVFVEAQLGEPIDQYWTQHAQLYVDEAKNAAALCVFRPK